MCDPLNCIAVGIYFIRECIETVRPGFELLLFLLLLSSVQMGRVRWKKWPPSTSLLPRVGGPSTRGFLESRSTVSAGSLRFILLYIYMKPISKCLSEVGDGLPCFPN